MKTSVLFFSFTLTLLFSCKKDPGCTDPTADNFNDLAEVNDGSCTYSGQVVFWMGNPFNFVDVNVNGCTKTISVYYPSGGVTCGSNGCATFDLPIGTYSYSAEEEGSFGLEWSGYFIVEKNTCLTLQLTP